MMVLLIPLVQPEIWLKNLNIFHALLKFYRTWYPTPKKPLETITATLKKFKQIIVFTRRTVVTSGLKRLQEREDKEALKFVLDVETRWNYTLTMVERFSNLQ